MAPKQRQAPVVLGTPWDFSKHPNVVYTSLFCGMGGDTTGGVQGLMDLGFEGVGKDIRAICVNHSEVAIEQLLAIHPEAEHYNCDVESLDPRTVLRGQRITVLWWSAPCQEWSNAASGPCKVPQKRATPDYAIQWIRVGKPEVIIQENVWEIQKRWPGWEQHLREIEAEGYTVEVRKLNAADYGTPQARHRLIMVARRGRKPVVWPAPTHSDPADPVPGTLPWLPAISCIDTTLWCPSLFDGRRDSHGGFLVGPDGGPVPHSPITRGRISRYIRESPHGRFWGPLADSVDAFAGKVPLRTLLAACPEREWPQWVARERDGRLVLTGLEFVLGQQGGHVGSPVTAPSPTLATAGFLRHVELRCVLPPRGIHGGPDSNPAYDPLDRPSHTLLANRASGHFVEARVLLPPLRTKDGTVNGARSVDEPFWTTLASHGQTGPGRLVELRFAADLPAILPHHGEDRARGQLPRYHRTSRPAPTIPAERRHEIAVPLIYTYNGEAQVHSAYEPSTTQTTVPRHALVLLRLDDLWADVGIRQLTTRETALLQGFPPGIPLIGTIEAQQRGIGNSVPPPLARALVRGGLSMTGIKSPRAAKLNEFMPSTVARRGHATEDRP